MTLYEGRRAVFVGLTTLLLGATIVGAAGRVVFRPEIVLLETNLRAEIERVRANVEEVKGIALDNLCGSNPSNRRCK